MSDRPVSFTPSGPPETVLDAEPATALDGLQAVLSAPVESRRDLIAAVVAAHPRFLDGWARLGQSARDDVEAYAAFRVGYHRGLDRLRANGWRGSGYVRWSREETAASCGASTASPRRPPASARPTSRSGVRSSSVNSTLPGRRPISTERVGPIRAWPHSEKKTFFTSV